MKIDEKTVSTLEDRAYEIRRRTIDLLDRSGAGHPGGSLSEADILAVLYFHEMNVDPQNPRWEDRDIFVLSKAHACPAYYATLALRGYFNAEECDTAGWFDSILQAHPDMRKTPGVDMSAGSLGQGLSCACGMAWAKRRLGKYSHVYCLVGDGESQEGQIWEAAMSAAHYKLDNLTVIVDYNKVQAKGYVFEQMAVEPVADKWRAFGWQTVEVDGHDIAELLRGLYKARWINRTGRPTAIIAHTVKGRGVAFMEFNYDYHGHAPTGELARQARQELARFYGRQE
jgi:transketolase